MFSLFFICVGLPGVLFVLPDSYVDPENKDYGGEDLMLFFCVFLTTYFPTNLGFYGSFLVLKM